MGTLLAFIIVAISILILRYVPPDKVPLPSSFHESVNSMHYSTYETRPGDPSGTCTNVNALADNAETSSGDPLIVREGSQGTQQFTFPILACQIGFVW